MATNTLNTTYVNGDVIDSSHLNELTLTLLGDFVGRNTSGVPSVGKNLGTLALPWGNVYAQGIVLNGLSLDTSQITSLANRIVSGKTRALSQQPDFITPNGAELSFILKGATTNLVLSINNVATTVSTDITKTGITAAPSTNNTCQVNKAGLSNDKYFGEYKDGILPLDTMGSEISALVGQVIALKNGTEIMIGYLKSTTALTSVYRGYFFDSSGNPLTRQNLSDNTVLTLLKLGWVFVENNGTTVDVSYKTPVTAYVAPTSPAAGDYWFDMTNQVWKRYNGASWDIINRMLVGVVASDSTNTIAARSFDFYKAFSDFNNVELEIFSTEIVRSTNLQNRVSVYGTEIQTSNALLNWNITTDLESPQTEAVSTPYFLYLTTEGKQVMSNERPYDRKDLKGLYHPYHSWRCIGYVKNNASSNIDAVAVLPQKHIEASYYLSAGYSLTAGFPINYDVKDFDNNMAVTTGGSTWKFTAPLFGNGTYEVNVNAAQNSTNATFELFKNGADAKHLAWISSAIITKAASHVVKLYEGEYLYVTTDLTCTLLSAGPSFTYQNTFSITKTGDY